MDLNRKKTTIFIVILILMFMAGVCAGTYSILKKDIKLTVSGEVKNISTFKSNVEEVLKEQSIKYDNDDKINLKLDEKLKDGIHISIIDINKKSIKEYEEIAYEVEIVEDKNLLKGKTEVVQEGRPGKNELIYDLIFHDGEQVDKKFIKEVVSVEPVNKIIKKGTKEELMVASSRGVNRENKNENYRGRHMKVVATAYTGHSITSTGAVPSWGTIAVDTSVIPYGTKVYIPQFNKVFIAQDTGGAIKGNKIDIYMGDKGSVYNWGRKTIDIYVL